MAASQQSDLIPLTLRFPIVRQTYTCSPVRPTWRMGIGLAMMVSFGVAGATWGQSEKLSPSVAQGVVHLNSKMEAPAAPSTPNAVSWQAATAYPEAVKRYGFAQNGEDLYVISGDTVGGGFTSAVRRFNATTNIWTSLANIPSPSEGPVAAFQGGKIYVADGFGFGFGGAFRVYDIATNTWSFGPSRPNASDSFGAAAGSFNGKVYIVGGTSGNFSNTLLSIYDIGTNTWSVGPAAPSPFYLGGYAQNGRYLYLVGSLVSGGPTSTVTQRLDMATNTWTTGPAWPTARGQCALVVAGTKLIAIGGDGPSAQVDELDTATWPTGTWVASPDNLPSPRTQFSAGFVSTGRTGGEIWSTGGEGPGGILKEHLFRAIPTCLDYFFFGTNNGVIVPGTVDIGNHTDDGSTVVTLPFSFRLYDQEFSSVSVGSNGHLTFGTVNDTFDPTCIPVAGATYSIGPYWTDQCTGACTGVSGTGLGIFTSISGSAPNRIFNIEWRTAYWNSGGNGVPLNYEVRLYENQAAFDVIYGTVNTFTPPQPRKLSAGIQKNSAGPFLSVGCDPTGGTAPPVSSGQFIHYVLTSATCAAAAPAPTGFLYALLDVNGGANQIYGFSVNETTGVLTQLAGFPLATGGNGTGSFYSERMAVDQVNQRLYAIDGGPSTVNAYVINPTTGGLAPMPFSPFAGGGKNTVAVHPTGSPLIIGGSSQVTSFTITPTTAVGSSYPISPANAFSSGFSRDGGFYYAGGNSGTSFAGFSVNAGTGALTALAGSPFDSGASSPAAYATDSQGRFYSSNIGTELRVFTTSAGVPSAVTGNPFASGLAQGVDGVLHPNEQFYFVVARDFGGNPNANQVGSYRVAGSGAATTLTPVPGSPFLTGGTLSDAVVMNQTGSYLFAANVSSRNLSSLNVNPTTGGLSNLVVQPVNTLGATGVITGLAYTNPSMVRTVVSRKTHGAAGVFDVNLPLTGTPGVECRLGTGGTSNDHQFVISFANKVTVPQVGVAGTFTGGNFGVSGNVVTVNLLGVANAQTVTVILDSVTDGVNTGTVTIPIGFLVGDTNGDASVNSADISLTKSKSGQPVDGTNFRTDVNADGSLNSADISLVKSKSGTGFLSSASSERNKP